MNIEIANRLVNLRKEMGLSQEQLAEKIGVSRQAVSKWERSEASPDTDNIILLARLYNISLDELLRTEDDIPQAEEAAEEVTEESATEPEADGFDQTEAETAEETTEKTTDENFEKNFEGINGDKVHIGPGGIDVHNQDGTKVHVGFDGIFVNDAHNGDNVHVSKNGIFVNDEHYKNIKDYWHNRPRNKFTVPIVMLSVIAFLGFGFYGLSELGLGGNGWDWSWIYLLEIPILCSLETAIRRKNPSRFAYPVLMIFLFCFAGFFANQNAWVLFVTIPIYYALCDIIKGKKAKLHIFPVLVACMYVAAGLMTNIWHPTWIIFFTLPIFYWAIDMIKKNNK